MDPNDLRSEVQEYMISGNSDPNKFKHYISTLVLNAEGEAVIMGKNEAIRLDEIKKKSIKEGLYPKGSVQNINLFTLDDKESSNKVPKENI